MTTGTAKTFFITGVSTGLGRAFAVGALTAGRNVAGTVRKPGDAEVFEALDPAVPAPTCWMSPTTPRDTSGRPAQGIRYELHADHEDQAVRAAGHRLGGHRMAITLSAKPAAWLTTYGMTQDNASSAGQHVVEQSCTKPGER